jgi:hypothetical protein
VASGEIIYNTHGQLLAAGGGIALMPHVCGVRQTYVEGWIVYRINAKGAQLVTDTKAHWSLYGCKWIHADRPIYRNWHERQRAALEMAKAWVLEAYDEAGPWVRNRTRDYVPQRINAAFPIPKRSA